MIKQYCKFFVSWTIVSLQRSYIRVESLMARTTYKDRQNAALMILKYFFVESLSNNVTNKNIYRTCIYYILHFVYLSNIF